MSVVSRAFVLFHLNIIYTLFLLSRRRSVKESLFPLMPFLKRFQKVLRSTFSSLNDYDVWCDRDSDDAGVFYESNWQLEIKRA